MHSVRQSRQEAAGLDHMCRFLRAVFRLHGVPLAKKIWFCASESTTLLRFGGVRCCAGTRDVSCLHHIDYNVFGPFF